MPSGDGADLGDCGRKEGPYRVISQLGLYGFDEETRRMRLIAVHPGVGVEEALAASGFELLVAGEVAETIPPTEEQKRIMHELDPAGLILGRQPSGSRHMSEGEKNEQSP